MQCSKCGGRTVVKDGVSDTDANEKYRKRGCVDCGSIFYTVEYEVEKTDTFKSIWNTYHRDALRRKRRLNML